MTVPLQLVCALVAAAEPAAAAAHFDSGSGARELVIQILYLAASVLFIFGLRGLTAPDRARRGMQLAAVGMLAAIAGTLIDHRIVDYTWIIVGLILGSGIGAAISIWMPMTAVPQRTAISHAFGALAATLVGIAHYDHITRTLGEQVNSVDMAALGFEVMFGSLTVTGSLMAFGKLQELLPGAPITYKFQNASNIALFVLAVLMFLYLVITPSGSGFHAIVFYLMVLVGSRGRRADRGAHRRRRHAGRDLAVEFLRRAGGLGHRLCAGQQCADHRRCARRGLGLPALDSHEPGHEPLVHQRAVRRLRRHRGQRGLGRHQRLERPQRHRSKTPPRSSPTRAM